MKKQILLFVLCLFTTTVVLNAQKSDKFDRSEMLKEKLGLSDTQMEQFKEMKETLGEEMREIKESDLSKEEMWEKMKQLGDKKQEMMSEILTPEQMEKMEQMHDHRGKKGHHGKHKNPESFEKRKEAMKAKHEDMKKFMMETVMPYMTEKRSELDKQLKKKDRKQINKYREIAKELKEEMHAKMKEKHEARKKAFENGEHPPHKGKDGMHPPHHKKHGKKGGMHRGHWGKDMMHMMKFMKEYQDEYNQLEEYATKYADEIDQLMEDVKTQKEEWGKEMKEIHKKHAPDWKSHKKGKEGKTCPKDKSNKCDKGQNKCDKSKGKWDMSKWEDEMPEEFKQKMKTWTRIGFLLTPSDMEDVIEERETPEVKTLTSKVFPNPSTNSNTIEVEVVEKGKYLIELYNETGQKVKVVSNKKLDVGTSRFQVDLTSLPSGMYYYIISDGKNTTTQKFVKN